MNNIIKTPIHSIRNGLLGIQEAVAKISSASSKRELILGLLKGRFEIYANKREGMTKNGGCSLYMGNHLIAYLYAVVSTNGEVIFVKKNGMLFNTYKRLMVDHLMRYLQMREDENQTYRMLIPDYIDSPLKM